MAALTRLTGRVRQRITSSARLRVVRLLLQTSRAWSVALAAFVLLSATLPVMTLAAMGQVVGRIPAAAHYGLGSPQGHGLFLVLALSVAAYAANLVLGPLQGTISSVLKVQLTYAMQARLIAAVSAPYGTGHLEDAAVLDELELANGKLTSFYPADAAMSLAIVTGTRLSGVLACAVLGTYRWWLGLGMLCLWVGVRTPLKRVTAENARTFGRSAGPMRRARYLQQLAVKPPVAKETRVFGFGNWLVDRFREQWASGMEETWQGMRRYNIGVTRLGGLVAAGYAAAIAVLALGAYDHDLTLTGLSTYLPMLVASAEVGDVSWTDVALEFQLVALPNLEKLEERLRPPTGPRAEAAPAKAPKAPAPALGSSERTAQYAPGSSAWRGVRFEHVSFRYPHGEGQVFRDLCLDLPSGQSTAIVGYNGAGKTTIVKLLARLHEASGGRITVDGTDLAATPPEAWQRQVAVVFQDFVRYPFSAAENIGVGAVEHLEDLDAVRSAAARAGLTDVLSSLPFGLATKLSRQYDRGTDLSGGQWQRVALARALMAAAHGARILVLDEPTAWLDARGEAEFFANFLDITAGLTTLIISHRFSTVRRADRICVLDGGAIVETGTHNDLVKAGHRYAQMFAAQSERFASASGDGTDESGRQSS
ncbi:MAG TPA: ABC transporter ATP-binding protein [Acidimicrobiales bacterium]|nr:ABC transporter ATP-binding protein [Acidimicrobiales bacterium]